MGLGSNMSLLAYPVGRLRHLKVAENALGGRVARSISRALLATVELALSFATTLT